MCNRQKNKHHQKKINVQSLSQNGYGIWLKRKALLLREVFARNITIVWHCKTTDRLYTQTSKWNFENKRSTAFHITKILL